MLAAKLGKHDSTIVSEALEPFAEYLIGRWFAKCEEAKKSGDGYALEDAWQNFWFGLHGLQSVSVACPEAVHFAMFMSNVIVRVAGMIEKELSVRPMEHPAWKS